MKIIVLQEPDIINGVLRVAGEVVIVSDDYANVRRVIQQTDTRKAANEQDFAEVGIKKLIEILQGKYLEFWQQLEKEQPELLDKALIELRENPDLLRQALDDPQGFVDRIMKEMGGKDEEPIK